MKEETTPVIPLDALNSQETPFKIPVQTNVSGNTAVFDDINKTIEGLVTTPSVTETEQKSVSQRLLETLRSTTGRKEAQAEAEKAQGVPQLNQEFQGIASQINALKNEAMNLQVEAQTIPTIVEQQSVGRRSASQASVMSRRALQDNQIQQASLASQALRLQSVAYASLGKIQLAQGAADRAVEAEFAPLEKNLEILREVYSQNKDALEREDKKRADMLGIILNERTRLLNDEKSKKEQQNKLWITAQQYGADSETIRKMQQARSPEEAAIIGGAFLQDPKAKQELLNSKLDYDLKKAQILKMQKETLLLGEKTKEQEKEEREALKKAETAIPILQDKISLIDSIKNSSALQTRVGSSMFGRGIFTGAQAVFVPGTAQNFAASVHQLAAKEFIDAVLSMKQQGGTLGALNEREGEQLRQAATKINDWETGDDSGFWKINEGAFIEELDRIKNLTNVALSRSTGDIFSDDESTVFNNIHNNALSAEFNPAF